MYSFLTENINRIVLSAPKNSDYKKIYITKTNKGYKCEKLTDTQSFTEILSFENAAAFATAALSGAFSNLTAFDEQYEYSIKITKKGKRLFSKKAREKLGNKKAAEINREKNYIIPEGKFIPPLFEMGLITENGVVKSDMYGKFRQLNRFIELIDDKIKNIPQGSEIKIADFGCGKSYLSFALYWYLTEIKKLAPLFVCIDLKEDVIKNCERIAKKYNYCNMKFICGDIMSAENIRADILITLHACDTATDFALRFAVKNGIKFIFSVPCCQHEINAQISEHTFPILLRHGIIKERFSALLTDALRADYLTANGYKTQIIEFTGFDDTPKNLLIRAELSNISAAKRQAAKIEAREVLERFGVEAEVWK
ncbi:MAG: SAM-dependent methyltransferase [Ruminococcus sp.]|jgi:SAM-dependent methyltransferase|nr:SAM-dependent methyltransferase [Ruminococcus sp.]